VPSSAPSSPPSSAASQVSQSSVHRDGKQQTRLALTSASGSSSTHGLYFLQDFVEVGGGTARGGESGDGGEQFHVDLDGRTVVLVDLRSLGTVEAWWVRLHTSGLNLNDLHMAKRISSSRGVRLGVLAVVSVMLAEELWVYGMRLCGVGVLLECWCVVLERSWTRCGQGEVNVRRMMGILE
jgi:hypothetical protein